MAKKPDVSKSDLNVRLTVLENDVNNVTNHVNRLDNVLEVLKDLVSGISKMIAIHEEKHKNRDKNEERLTNIIANQESTIESIEKAITNMEARVIALMTVHRDDAFKEIKKVENRLNNLEKKVVMITVGISIAAFIFNFFGPDIFTLLAR